MLATSEKPRAAGAARGVWLGASHALSRTVTATEPYPHICGTSVTGRMTGRAFRLTRRDCGACSQTN